MLVDVQISFAVTFVRLLDTLDHRDAHVVWSTIDADAYSSVLEGSPFSTCTSNTSGHFQQTAQKWPAVLPEMSLYPDTVHEVPVSNVAFDAAKGTVATYALNESSVARVMSERSLFGLSSVNCGWIQWLACGRALSAPENRGKTNKYLNSENSSLAPSENSVLLMIARLL